MATVSSTSNQTADLLGKLSLDSQTKTLEIPESTEKTAVYQYGSMDSNGQVQSFDRSATPMLSETVDPSIFYIPNGYHPYYHGGYGIGHEWSEYSGCTNADGVDVAAGVMGEDGFLIYPHDFGYAPYSYSPATSPGPTVGNDGQLYGAQQYQYPSYFPLPPSSGPVNSTVTPSSQEEHSANKTSNQKPVSVESTKAASTASGKIGVSKGSNDSTQVKQANQSPFETLFYSHGNGALGSASYQALMAGYNGVHSTVHRPLSGTGVASTFSKVNGVHSSRNQNYCSNSHFMGLHQPASMTGNGTGQLPFNRLCPNNLYGWYGSAIRSGFGYDSRTNGRGCLVSDRKYRPSGRGFGYFYGNENSEGLNELNRGPRAKGTKNQKGVLESTLEVKRQNGPSNAKDGEEKDDTCVILLREQYNREEFPENYAAAKFFIIKSYSEDDVHKSVKHNVWASTPNGNKKLDAAYQEAQQKSGGCPVFLFFSVNTSGQFVGLAEMVGPVDFNKNVEYWQQDKWTGSLPLKWHILKDVPNGLMKHIILENNENKPVTNSRDTQEVKLEPGLKMIKIFKDHSSKTCILDDFVFYEARQKTVQEKKAKQQQSLKQVWEGKSINDKKEPAGGLQKRVSTAADTAKDLASTIQANGNLKVSENGSVAKTGHSSNSAKQVGVLLNGMANGC